MLVLYFNNIIKFHQFKYIIKIQMEYVINIYKQ